MTVPKMNIPKVEAAAYALIQAAHRFADPDLKEGADYLIELSVDADRGTEMYAFWNAARRMYYYLEEDLLAAARAFVAEEKWQEEHQGAVRY